MMLSIVSDEVHASDSSVKKSLEAIIGENEKTIILQCSVVDSHEIEMRLADYLVTLREMNVNSN